MTVQQIEYFLLIAETGSFSKAAERAYVSQPAISKQVTLLEKELGVTLFDRRYRKATLTPPGEIVCETLLRHQTEFGIACREAKQRFSQWINAVWLGLPGNYSMGNLHEKLGQFQREHSELSLKVDIGAGRELAVRSSGEDFDLILTPKLLPMERQRVCAETVYTGHYAMLISRSHPGFREDLRLHEVEDSIYLAAPGSLARDAEARQKFINDFGLKDSAVLVVPTVDTVIGIVRSQLGVGIVSDLVTVPKRYDLAVLPLDKPFELELAWREENDNPYLPMLRDLILEEVVIAPDN